MTTQARCETSLNALLQESLLSEQQEQISGPQPLRDGIRFTRGALLAIAICLPIWLVVFWAFTRHF